MENKFISIVTYNLHDDETRDQLTELLERFNFIKQNDCSTFALPINDEPVNHQTVTLDRILEIILHAKFKDFGESDFIDIYGLTDECRYIKRVTVKVNILGVLYKA